MSFTVRALGPDTWDAFEALADAHRGVWGGCWCTAFHGPPSSTPGGSRALKRELVHAGKTHAALVFEGDACAGWCQYGPPAELWRIKHAKRYGAGLETLPDWRITCFFVGSNFRRRGVADAGLAGALELIAAAGGGVVESYPEDVEGRKSSSSFLYNATVAMFERHGFSRVRQIGKHHWVVTREV